MDDRNQIPDDDRDLKLARAIGERLEEGRDLSDLEDPLADQVEAYRESAELRGRSAEVNSRGIWAAIEQNIAPRSKPAPLYRLDRRQIWAAAAVVLIALTSGIYLLFSSQQPVLVAESGSQMQEITLRDGSSVTLRPHSTLHLADESGDRVEYMLTGEGFFRVSHNPQRTFSVTAGNGRVSVLGTRFMVSSWGDLMQVYLEEGSVSLQNRDRTSSLLLEPGEAAFIQENELSPALAAEPQQYLDWLNNELAFSDRRADYVFSELEQHFDISISAPDSISQTRIGGQLGLESLEASLNDLETVLGGTFEPTGNGSFRFVTDE